MNYDINLFSGENITINQKQYEVFLQMSSSNARGMELSGKYISFSAVSSVVPQQEMPKATKFLPEVKLSTEQEKAKRVRIWKSFVNGLNKYILSLNNKPTNAIKLLEEATQKLELARDGKNIGLPHRIINF